MSKMVEELKKWLNDNHITYNMRHDIIWIKDFGKMLYQDMDDSEHIFSVTKDGNTVFDCQENIEYLKADEIYYVAFKFGDRFYYIDIRESKPEFYVLKYLGNTPVFRRKFDFCPLGIHSGFELLNGSGAISDWVKKAKFLGYKGLSICDKNTLASSLNLQMKSDEAGMKYTFGYSLDVKIGDATIGVKIYSKNQNGFNNLLRIQKAINVDREDDLIDVTDLMGLADDNYLVFDKWSGKWLVDNENELKDLMGAFKERCYFQVDTSEYRADRVDVSLLESMKAYFDHFYLGKLKYKDNLRPILIQDSYYLDADYWKNKVILNKVDIGASHENSYLQYMKTPDELYDEFRTLFSDKYDDEVFYDMCKPTVEIVMNADVKYDLTENYAPKYDLTETEKLIYGDSHTMFSELIEKGFERLVPKDKADIYRKRVEYEKYVIESTDNVDYFLIQYDTLNWARQHGILTGIGRGSAGGSLLLYLMGITMIDPIKWNLIFERFLLPERAGLTPEEVTVIGNDMESNDYVELKMENGKTYKFDSDSQLKVKRGEKIMVVYADQLKSDDDIIFDNRDLIWTLNEIGNE